MKLVCGHGVNDADYAIHPDSMKGGVICRFYRTWANMLSRCYSPAYHRVKPTYIGCTVCDEWLSFMAFRAWMVKQDWEGKCLDKDITTPGNKIYSPGTCVFVSSEVNSLLNDHTSARGIYPIGVSKNGRRFCSRITRYGEEKNLGTFDTPGQAASSYGLARASYIRNVASEQVDERVSKALLVHAGLYESKTVC